MRWVIEIVYIKGKADWIMVEGMDDVPFNAKALEKLGLQEQSPSFKKAFVIKWEPYGKWKGVSLFKGKNNADYAYIKVNTQ